MSLPWKNRKRRLQDLLNSQGDEQEDGLALDRLLHGHHVIGKTARTTEIDQNRFQDADFRLVGALDYGQFGTIDVVNCRLNGRVYVRKTIEKKFAQRTREQCCPQIERDILIQAKLTGSQWAPHLLCAFQTTTHLKLVMEYAEGGTLWDVLESSPFEGRISEANVRWWAPQIISAVHWCHSQGYVHRDIKPHNFVLKPHGHLLLIDFGSAAPLLPPLSDGSQRLPKSHCLVPCGTCDYISPEILKAHEQALVALEMSGEVSEIGEDEAYGRETDWWSVGAMLYEMTYGVAPFFADDVRKTYAKIIDANRYVRFKASFTVSMALQRFIGGLLKDAEFRLGRRSINELTSHEFFQGVNWATLPAKNPPADLHTPQFTYADPNANLQDEVSELNDTKPFAFSELFQSSLGSSAAISILRDVASPGHSQDGNSSVFIGFSWGPTPDAFPGDAVAPPPSPRQTLRRPSSPIPLHTTPAPYILTTPLMNTQRFSTPLRSAVRTPFQTLSLNRNSTIRRTVARRAVSDREAFKQLADCVGMSARKRVLESGRKPRIIPTARSRSGSFKKELRFYPTPGEPDKIPVNGTDTEETDTDMDSDGPPSPSPSPRPGSSMSRRSATPTVTGTFSKMMLGDVSQRTFSDVSLRSRRDSFRQNSLVDDLEMKHVSLMRNIRSLEQRLEMLSSTVEDD